VSGLAPAELIAELAALDYDCILVPIGKKPRRIRKYTGRDPISVVFVPRETAAEAVLSEG
jgi:hypothetical protein